MSFYHICNNRMSKVSPSTRTSQFKSGGNKKKQHNKLACPPKAQPPDPVFPAGEKKVHLKMQSLRPESQHSLRRLVDKVNINGAKMVVRCIAKEMLPFSTVEKPALREMLQTFDRQNELPARKYMSQTA